MCKSDHMSGPNCDELLPYTNVSEPLENDVLLGRGGGTNHHPGNKVYRKTVEDAKVEYLGCTRLEKPLVALRIVKKIRQARGRFLKLDKKTGLWNDVGDKKAREKTSQALREQAPEIRKTLDIEPSQKWDIEEETFDHETRDIKEDGAEEQTVLEEEAVEKQGVASILFDSIGEDDAMFPDECVNDNFLAPLNIPPQASAPLESLLTSDVLEFSTQTSVPAAGFSFRDHSLALNPLPHATLKSEATEDWSHDSMPSQQKSKRATSHQNENPETRRGYNHSQSTVKRASVGLEDRMSSLDLDAWGDSIVPQGEQERLSSIDLIDLVTPVEEI